MRAESALADKAVIACFGLVRRKPTSIQVHAGDSIWTKFRLAAQERTISGDFRPSPYLADRYNSASTLDPQQVLAYLET